MKRLFGTSNLNVLAYMHSLAVYIRLFIVCCVCFIDWVIHWVSFPFKSTLVQRFSFQIINLHYTCFIMSWIYLIEMIIHEMEFLTWMTPHMVWYRYKVAVLKCKWIQFILRLWLCCVHICLYFIEQIKSNVYINHRCNSSV